MEFAVVNNYMGPVATKVMKGYSEDDIRGGDEFKVGTTITNRARIEKKKIIKNYFLLHEHLNPNVYLRNRLSK